MASQQCKWPKEAHTVGNAGVMLVGRSAQHRNLPVALLGGRHFTRRNKFLYNDFGGGVDRQKGETPQQGAFREFAEEFFGQAEKDARATADNLCSATAASLLGGRPFVHKKSYVMFVVPAEVIVDAMQFPSVAPGISAIDQLFELAVRNAELSSVALVSIEELLQQSGAMGPIQNDAHTSRPANGFLRPLSVRHLDGVARDIDLIELRSLLVGSDGSISTILSVLEEFSIQASPLGKSLLSCPELEQIARPSQASRLEIEGDELSSAIASYVSVVAGPPRRRWGRLQETSDSLAENRGPPSVASQASVSPKKQGPVPYVFDMETGDPDDVLTLLFMCSHPGVEVRAVTITPGTEEQVALVRWILQQLSLTHVRLGAQEWPTNANKPVNLGARFYRSFGRAHSGDPVCEPAAQVLFECCDASATLVTGAPLHNLGAAVQMREFRLGRWVAQGGFAGEGVVPPDKQMDKFKRMEVCPTWNFGGNIPAAQAALASPSISRKIAVSKNVCHSVFYDSDWHEHLRTAAELEARKAPQGRRAVAFRMMYDTMDDYLRHKPGGKKLHDPLALAVALDENVCELSEVELFCRKGQWGSRLSQGSNIWISVAYDALRFRSALLH